MLQMRYTVLSSRVSYLVDMSMVYIMYKCCSGIKFLLTKEYSFNFNLHAGHAAPNVCLGGGIPESVMSIDTKTHP